VAVGSRSTGSSVVFLALQRPEREKKDRAHGVGNALSFFIVDVVVRLLLGI
jgi:hypothetical protein